MRLMAVTAAGIAALWSGVSMAGAQDTAGAADAAPKPSAKEAGQRYGQALGVLEVCYGSKLTAKAKALETAYTSSDLDTFKAAAAGVYDAWVKVRACTNQKDPNTCKIIMDKSCLAAEAEIAPEGSAVAGLVDFLKH